MILYVYYAKKKGVKQLSYVNTISRLHRMALSRFSSKNWFDSDAFNFGTLERLVSRNSLTFKMILFVCYLYNSYFIAFVTIFVSLKINICIGTQKMLSLSLDFKENLPVSLPQLPL